MKADDFASSLVRSARTLDVPADGAKSRALEGLASKALVATSAASAANVVATTVPAKLGLFAWSVAAAAAIVGGAGGYEVGRVTSPRVETSVVAPSTISPDRAPEPPRVVAPASPAPAILTHSEDAARPPVNACLSAPLVDKPPTTCSHTGKAVPISIKNACGGDVDVFWIDDKCEEVFHTRLAPEASWRRVTQDGHVWRIRDHASHALLKEFVPQRVPGAPELVHNAPRRTLPDVVVHANDEGKEEAPLACSGAGLPTKLTIKNEHDSQIVVMWLSSECEEKYHARIEPKRSLVINGVDADAWRIRDAKTGAVITDVVPEIPDTTTYITVP